MPELRGRLVLLAGATSTSGLIATDAVIAAGARVMAVGLDPARLARLEARGAMTEASDLTDEAAVERLRDRVHERCDRVHGILHLVGGWSGGGGLAGQTDARFRGMERSLTALRLVSRAFDPDLRASDAAREAIVSSTSVERPRAGGANYVAIKAASEAWAHAVADGFATAARTTGEPLRAASVIFRVAALAGREKALADAFVALWSIDADAANGRTITL